MRHKFHQSALAYNSFDRLVGKINKALLTNNLRLAEFSKDEVLSRVTQRIVSISFNPYVKNTLQSLRAKDTLLSTGVCNFGGLKICLDSGEIKVTKKLILRSVAEYFYDWVRLCFNIVRGAFSASEIKRAGTLVYGVPSESLFFNNSDERFKEFCKTTQISPITLDKRLIVQSVKHFNSDQIEFAKDPLCKLIINTKLGWLLRIKLFVRHLINPFECFFCILKNPIYGLLARDFASLSLINLLSKKKLIESVVITNSNYANQPLWMRESQSKYGFKTHEVHYSQNSKPLLFKQDPIDTDLPHFRHVKVDEHWVWTEGYKKHIEILGHQGKINVVGSIMFQPRSIKVETKELCIAVFDVTPIREDRVEEIGIINNYYNYANMCGFIEGIVAAVENVEKILQETIKIHLKHKRETNQFHDNRYLTLCDKLETNKRIKLLTHNENIYAVIGSSKLAISIPYTSPAYIACEMGIPSVYFDSSDQIQQSFEKLPGLGMVSSSKELEKVIFEAMK